MFPKQVKRGKSRFLNCFSNIIMILLKVEYLISSNNSRGRLFMGGRVFDGGDYFKYCSLEVVP